MEYVIVPDSSNLGGNTKTPQIAPSKYWLFTLNNYNRQDIHMFRNIDRSIVPNYVFQQEVGECGTHHLQGFLMFKIKKRPKSVFENHKIHWDKKSPKSTIQQCIDYCSKEDTRLEGVQPYWRGWQRPYEVNIGFKPWQSEVYRELLDEADDRTINWIWEPDGRMGKTLFQKWCFINLDSVVVLSGKSSDMKHGVVKYKEETGQLPKIVLFNVPRTSLNYLNYCTIEEIKDMFFFSGKYEGGMICGANPHIYIFANEPPNVNVMSEDRWKIRLINRLHQFE